MARVRKTETFSVLTRADLPTAGTYIFAEVSTEDRGAAPVWSDVLQADEARCLRVREMDGRQVGLLRGDSPEPRCISLRDDTALAEVLSTDSVCIDMSGLSHHVWAPLIRVALATSTAVHVIYFEPTNYKRHTSPASVSLFDLSEGTLDIGPLPGFASLSPSRDERAILVAFLGFEGTRAKHLALSIDPPSRVIPVVGVPGFRVEYPAVAVACNQEFLEEHSAHAYVRYAAASCPYEAYDALVEVRKDFRDHLTYVAPVGTKPHALGAILFALDYPDGTELLYDNPRRKPQRTSGLGDGHVYTLKSP